MKFDVLNRFNGAVQFTCEIDATESTPTNIKLGLAIKWAVANKTDLSNADLSGAYLRGADLSGANLNGAYLSGADLTGAYLSGAYLRRANLSSAILIVADLRGANLSVTDLNGANLWNANLIGAYLSGADLNGAYLSGADLSSAGLNGANLRGANLNGATLSGADLRRADLSVTGLTGANLNGANLRGVNLSGADLTGCVGLENQPSNTVIVNQGSLIVFKKLVEGVATLRIPEEAKRSNGTGRKCRAEYAEVISLPEGVTVGHSLHDNSFTYEVGKRVTPDSFDPAWFNECAPGIHFFLTREEAEQYN